MVLFSLDKVPSPAKARPPPTLPLLERNRKVLKVGDLVVEEGPRPPAARRLPSTGDIMLALYKCTDDARIWVDVKNPDMGLWQVQVKHDTRDSVCYQIQGIVFLPPGSTREVGGSDTKTKSNADKFNAFLSQRPDGPKNTVELQREASVV